MHAIHFSYELDTDRTKEPYFEDEAVAELGYSYETAVSYPSTIEWELTDLVIKGQRRDP